MFGQSSAPAFGSPTPAFGAATSTFGTGGAAAPAPAASPFGAPAPAFGAAPAPATPFGAPAPAPATGFAFGAPAAAPGTTSAPAFGAAPATSAFGAPAPAPVFGAGATPAPAPGGFAFGTPAPAPAAGTAFGAASTTPFGAPAPAPSTGLFGSTTNTAASPFGAAPAPSTNIFGGTTTGAFGAAPAPAPSTGLFGSATPGASTSPFGTKPAAAPGGLFGSPAPAPATGLFGAPAPAAQQSNAGTSAMPYQVTRKQDGQTNISLQAITAMPGYENRSFEELRLEDYMAGNRGSQGQPQPGAAPGASTGFGFSAGTTGTTGFGATGGTAFGAASTTPFGAPAPAPGGLFGAPAPAPGGLFGAPAPAPGAPGGGLFGAPAPAPGTSAFGAPAPAAPFGGSTFGSTTPAPAPGAFSFNAPAPAPGAFGFGSKPSTGLFGSAPAPAPSTGLFGAPAPAPAPGGLFGASTPAPAPGGLFGTTPAPAPFGAPAPAPGGLFGAPAPAPLFGGAAPAPGGIFGSTAPAPAPGGIFGAPAPAPGGLFGSTAPAPAPGSLFGAPATPTTTPGGGLFGAPVAAPAPGAFGAPAPAASSGLFGFGAAAAAPGVGVGAAVQPPAPSADDVIRLKLAAIEAQRNELKLMEPWRGTSLGGALGGKVVPSSLSEADSAAYAVGLGGFSGRNSSYDVSPSSLYVARPMYPSTPRVTTRIQPRGFGPSIPQTEPPRGRSGLGDGNSLPVSPDAYFASSVKKLVIQKGGMSMRRHPKALLLTDGQTEGKSGSPDATGTSNLDSSFASPMARTNVSLGEEASPLAGSQRQSIGETSAAASTGEGSFASSTPNAKGTKDSPLRPDGGDSYDLYRKVVASPGPARGEETKESGAKQQNIPQDVPAAKSSFVPKLTKEGYTVEPSLAQLSAMSEADLAAVNNFTVSRPGYGSVAWEGAVDVRGTDLDVVVKIEDKAVEVYDDEASKGTKPPVGSKLNRPAIITLLHVFPKDRSKEALQKFERKIAKQTTKMGAELVSYDGQEGVWCFRTQHFSRYGLVEDDSEDEGEKTSAATNKSQGLPFNTTEKVQPSSVSRLALIPGGESDVSSSLEFDTGGRRGRPVQTRDTPLSTKRVSVSRRTWSPTRLTAPLSEDDTSESTAEAKDFVSEDGTLDDGEQGKGRHFDQGTLAPMQTAGSILMGSEQEMIAASDAAYDAIMRETEVTDTDEDTAASEKYEKEDDGAGTEQIQDCLVGKYVLPEPSPPHPEEVSCLVHEPPPRGSCAEIARRCGLKSFTTSQFDYGIRQGRCFRVGWRQDGTFVHSGLTGVELHSSSLRSRSISELGPSLPHRPYRRIVAQRAAFREGGAGHGSDASDLASVQNQLLPFLKVHQKHSIESCRVNDCPMFVLPSGLGAMGGSKSTYLQLCRALVEYEDAALLSSESIISRGEDEDTEVALVAARAFALITVLYGQDIFEGSEDQQVLLPVGDTSESGHSYIPDFDSSPCSSNQRREGFKQWLKEAVAFDVEREVTGAESRGDIEGAILAAATGGDISTACDIASRNGYDRLSALLVSSVDADEDLSYQINQWKSSGLLSSFSPSMVRLYCFLSGDASVEEELFKDGKSTLDWRRRLGLKMWTGVASVETAVHSFDDDVLVGSSPSPLPRYSAKFGDALRPSRNESTNGPMCLLYSLLRLRAGGGGRDGDSGAALATIISPSGYSAAPHDFSIAFHVASVVLALGCSPPMPTTEWFMLVDSYSTQLIGAGLWEWAVYIRLCSCPAGLGTFDQAKENFAREQSISVAKRIILHHYAAESSISLGSETKAKKREFLEKTVGVPSSWFDEALAVISGYKGEVFEHVRHLVSSNKMNDAAHATEQLIIPPPVLTGGESAQRLRLFLEGLREQGVADVPRWCVTNGCEFYLDLLKLAEEVIQLMDLDESELMNHAGHIADLSNFANELTEKIKLETDDVSDDLLGLTDTYLSCLKVADGPDINRGICREEAISTLASVSLQLNALKSSGATSDMDGGARSSDAEYAFLAGSKKVWTDRDKQNLSTANSAIRGVADAVFSSSHA